MSEKRETTRARAKREKRPFIRLTIDTRHSDPCGVCIDMETLADPSSIAAAMELWRKLIA